MSEKIQIFGYHRGHSGVCIYTEKLFDALEGLEVEYEFELSEPSRKLKPQAMNQILLNSFKFMGQVSGIVHLTNQDDLGALLPFPDVDNLVVTVHDLFRKTDPSAPLDEFRSSRYIKNIEKHADKVIAISEATKEQLLKHSEVEEDRIEVIYQGVDTEEFKPQGEVEHQNFILHVGTEIPRKNVEGLINIFEKYRERNPDAKLVRVGEMSETVKQKIDESNLEIGEDIIYEEDVSFDRLKALYTNAEKLAFPSHAEGFGRPIVEALACGTPVIAYDKKPMNEILPEKMLVQFGDEEEFVQKLTENYEGETREIARRFSWRNTAQQTIELYREL
jgi:glycosyltransferase involved in cell wall biosynthesis